MRPLSHSAEPVATRFHVTQWAYARTATMFHGKQSCDPAQQQLALMSAKTFHVKQPAALTSAKGDQKPTPLFHGKQATDDGAAALFHVTQLSEPAQQWLGPMSAKTFHVKQSAALTSTKGDQNPTTLFHGKQATDGLAAALFHVTQLSEPAQHRLGLWSEP